MARHPRPREGNQGILCPVGEEDRGATTRGARFRRDRVEGIDLAAHRVHLSEGSVEYDRLVIAIGGATPSFGIPGVEAYALNYKSLEDALLLRDHVIDLAEHADHEPDPEIRRRMLTICVVGGGYTAMDSSRTALRLGAKTSTIVYRRGPAQMSATAHEQEFAQTNGVKIKHWARPVRAVGMIDDPQQANDIIRHGRADMVALARAMLANPRWPWRAAAVLGHDIAVAKQYARAAHLPKKWEKAA